MLMNVSNATSKWLKIAEGTGTDDQKSSYSEDKSSQKSVDDNPSKSHESGPAAKPTSPIASSRRGVGGGGTSPFAKR
jgi:hypothetical protein